MAQFPSLSKISGIKCGGKHFLVTTEVTEIKEKKTMKGLLYFVIKFEERKNMRVKMKRNSNQ